MCNKNRITILLGAGAVCEATDVTTAQITKRVIIECKEFKISPEKSQSVVDYICKDYWERYGRNREDYKPYSKARLDDIVKYVNFEDIFHVVELLSGYSLKLTTKEHTTARKNGYRTTGSL